MEKINWEIRSNWKLALKSNQKIRGITHEEIGNTHRNDKEMGNDCEIQGKN